MNSRETFIPLAAALAIATASQRCSEVEYTYPDSGDAAVADAGTGTQTPDAGGPDTDNDGNTDTTQPDNGSGYDPGVIGGEDASLPPANPVIPPGLDEKACPGNSMPEGTEAPQQLNFFADDQFGALRMFLGDKKGNGAKKGLAVKDDAVGGYALPEDLATLPDIHSPDNTLFKEAGGGVLLFATGDSQTLGLETGAGGKNLGEMARWTNSMEKGNPANKTFEWPTTIYVQDPSKAPKDEQGVRTMLTELAQAIRKQDANLHGAVMAKYGLSKQYTTSGEYNDMFRTKLGEGFNVITFIAVPACEGSIDTSRAETRKGIQRIIVQELYAKRQPMARRPVADYRTRSRRIA